MPIQTSTGHSYVAERWEKGFHDCSLFNIICVAVLPCILSFCGLIGNTISMLIFWPDRHKSASSVLLLQLAVVDSLVLVIWSILCVTWVLEYFTDNPPAIITKLAPYTYKYGWPTAILIQMIACWLIVYITVQRYVAVCHPHKMRLVGSVRVAWIQLAVLVLFCAFFIIPRYLEVDIITLENGDIEMVDSWLITNHAYQLWYSVAYYLVSFIIPFFLLISFTAALIRKLKKMGVKLMINPMQPSMASVTPSMTNGHAVSDKTKNQQAKTQLTDKEKSISLSLIVVDIVFLICQPIQPIRSFCEFLLPPEKKKCGTPYFYYESLTATGIFINSSINFVIFCLCSKGFRRKLFQRLCSWLQAKPKSGLRHKGNTVC